MNQAIREKRKLYLADLRITLNSIKSLAQLIEMEASKLSQLKESFYLSYSVDADDDSSYESQSSIIFNEESIVKLKVIEKVSIRFSSSDYSKNIEVYVRHGWEDEADDNYILVSGTNSNWVSGTLESLTAIIDSFEPQPKILEKIQLVNGGAWFTGCIYMLSLFKQHFDSIKNESISSLVFITFIGIFFAGGILTSNYLRSILPVIEIQTGPEHRQLPKQKRKRVAAVLSLIIIPIVLTILYDIIKWKFY